ncbi:hypothetical protein E6H35_06325 [Candidatus Bathyarchaeota archaeon]|nr:MAG: hypothetical protein E6H35_06325 [Candidatus Bathyarchaeota archaeon]
MKVGAGPLNETLSWKIRLGAYRIRGDADGCEPGKGKGRPLARRRTSISTRLEIPSILLVSWETTI